MQLQELACSSLSLHRVTRACVQFLSLSEQLTRISQCLFIDKLTYPATLPSGWVAHVIIVSAQVPLVLNLGLWTLGLRTWA